MAATDTIPTGIDGRPLSAEDTSQSAGADADTARAFLIAAMKTTDGKNAAAHAAFGNAVALVDDGLRALAS